jgi:subtilisin
MSRVVQEELAAVGVASVICVLKESAAEDGSQAMAKIEGNFVASELSQQSAIAMDIASSEEQESVELPPAVRYYPNLGLAYGTVTREGLAALNSDERVAEVSGAPALQPIRPTRVAAAQLTQRLTWGIRAMRAEDLWKEGLTGDGVLVGHLDTGVDGRHRTLKSAIRHFARFDFLGRKIEPAPPRDTEEHGTHTAATIAGRRVGKKHVGVAPRAELASATVIEGGDVVARVLGGMDWAVGKRVRVLSMSLGFPGMWPDFRALTVVLRRRNILPVFAVGNEGPGTSRSPGNYGITLSVGANDSGRRVASFSSSQRFKRKTDPLVPDIVAPGVNVISARPGRGYQAMDGTSMATPHVAGLAALLIEAKPGVKVDKLERAIFASCKRSPQMPPGRANRGMPDAVRALRELTGP